MKITVTANGEIQLENIYDPIILKALSGQKMTICMRDDGFEIEHGGRIYSIYGGEIIKNPL